MPSQAHARWVEFVGDPQDLLQRLHAALQACESDPYALSRAVVVSVAAAWETYVEHLALESGRWLLSPQAFARLEAYVRSFNNAKAANVKELLTMVLDHDPWPHLTVPGKTVEQTKGTVSTYQTERHQIAHGRTRPQFTEASLNARIAFFDELVANAEQHFETVLTTELGHSPW